jgi:transcriptional regulator with XRE-family HTH domain
MLTLVSPASVQETLKDHLKSQRKKAKLSRDQLAERSTVPAPTIKKFETTGQISLRQFLLLWQSVDDLTRLEQLIQVSAEVKMPTTIAEVLHGQ